jgi:hypothetical protein
MVCDLTPCRSLRSAAVPLCKGDTESSNLGILESDCGFCRFADLQNPQGYVSNLLQKGPEVGKGQGISEKLFPDNLLKGDETDGPTQD